MQTKRVALAVIVLLFVVACGSTATSSPLVTPVVTTPAPTIGVTPVLSMISTPMVSPTETLVPAPTATSIPESTATSAPAPTAVPTLVPTATPSLVFDATAVPVPTPVPATATPAPLPTATSAPTPTAVPTLVPTATQDPTPVPAPISGGGGGGGSTSPPDPTAVPTPVPTPTAVPTPVPTATPDPTPVPAPTATLVPPPTATPVPLPTATPVPAGDTTPPAAVSDLIAFHATGFDMKLTWTAPGDDGNTGTATSYDVRFGNNWNSATQVAGEPTPSVAGTAESMVIGVGDLPAYENVSFFLRVSDETSNESETSNVASCGTYHPLGVGQQVWNSTQTSSDPRFNIQVTFDPGDIQAGGTQNLTIGLSETDGNAITSFSGTAILDNSVSVPISFTLDSGTTSNGTWIGSWIRPVGSTYCSDYRLEFQVTSDSGPSGMVLTLK